MKEEGQATIEFTLVMILLIGFVFFYVQLALILGWSNYIQYATYLSARAYVSGGPDAGDQKERAEKVLNSMLKKGAGERVPFLARDDKGGAFVGKGPEFSDTDRDSSWLEGARYSFKSKVFLLPVGKSELPGEEKYLHLTSETWLGREPSEAECRGQLPVGAVIDNGC